MTTSFISLLVLIFMATSASADTNATIEDLKKEIIETARTYEGLGDPDFKIQNTLEPLVQKLLEAAPQKPIKERIEILNGTWKQVWGPYDYRNDDRGVDPELSVLEIYQMVSKNGRPVSDFWTLAPLSEAGQLENEITIVPDLVVKLFFKGGTLIEVYTDDTLRVLYGTGGNFSKPYLYIMTRIL